MSTAAEQLWGGLTAEYDHLRHLSFDEVALNAALTAGAVIVCVLLLWLARRFTCWSLKLIPGLSHAERKTRAAKALRLTRWLIDMTITVTALFAICAVWGFDPLGWTKTPWGAGVAAAGSRVIVVVVIAAVALEASSLLLQYLLGRLQSRSGDTRRSAQLNTLGPIFRSAFQIAIVILAGMTLLSQVGVQIGPLLAGAGVAGIAIGFGAQTLVKDFFTGFFLIVEDIVAVGDVVQVQSFAGTVEAMTLRTIRLRDFDGTLHILPYGEAQIIHNMTKTFSYSAFDIPVKPEADVDKAMAVMKRVGEQMCKEPEFAPLMLDPVEIHGVDLLSDLGVILKGRIRTQPLHRWKVLREYYRRVKQGFDAEGIALGHHP